MTHISERVQSVPRTSEFVTPYGVIADPEHLFFSGFDLSFNELGPGFEFQLFETLLVSMPTMFKLSTEHRLLDCVSVCV